MNYQIKYLLSGKMKYQQSTQLWRRVAVFFGVTVSILALAVWAGGVNLPGVWTALEEMAQQVKEGGNLKDAALAFCLAILQGADCG